MEIFYAHDADGRFCRLDADESGHCCRVLRHRVGDEVTLEDPLFNGCQGRVVGIDWRKERAKVEFVFDRTSCSTWVSLDDVKKLQKPGEEKGHAITDCLQE